ncbi:MAG: glycine cleavage system aminomethyltransferase GcvT [Parvibaculaceae bacterium]
MATAADATPLKRTPLHALHLDLGARMVPFAGYDMPVQYPTGIMAEHLHTRASAGLFDVSHMGQAMVSGPSHEATAQALEALMPADILGLGRGRMRYSQLTNAQGGILDDLMVTRSPSDADDGALMLIVNAACKDADFAWIAKHLPADVSLHPMPERALLALQGPKAAEALARHCPKAADLAFMTAASAEFDGMDCHVSRSGYTGEDGFEISMNEARAEAFARALLAEPEVKPIGLGARDSLRLEAGLCLYGHDIDETTSPIEAGLQWSIGKRRREEGGFPGADRIRREVVSGPARKRVGLKPDGRQPVREGSDIQSRDGRAIGAVTSGGFGPSVGAPVAMGYVEAALAAPDTEVDVLVRGKPVPGRIVAMPFHPHAYKR